MGIVYAWLSKPCDNKGSAVGFVHEASQLLGLNQDDGPAVFSAIEGKSIGRAKFFYLKTIVMNCCSCAKFAELL